MPIAFFLIQALAAASPAVPACPLSRAQYRLADDAAITARFDPGREGNIVTIADGHDGRSFRFALVAGSRQLGQQLRFVGATGRNGTRLDYRPDYFRLARGFFFARDKTMVPGAAPSMAPPYFFPSGLTNALYTAGAERPQDARSYVPAGMFVLSGCRRA